MKSEQRTEKREDRFAFTMDLLGHDVLNNNQAVLSYLELVLAMRGLDPNVKRYAVKATSHIRASTILMSNMKTLAATRFAGPDSFKPVDLVKTIASATRELSKYFPEKRVSVHVKSDVKSALAIGDNVAANLVLNMLVGMSRLDPSESIDMDMTLGEKAVGKTDCWSIRLDDPRARLPPILATESIRGVYGHDVSRAVKLSEILFASIAAEVLGGDFDAGELKPNSKQPGAYLLACLRKAGRT